MIKSLRWRVLVWAGLLFCMCFATARAQENAGKDTTSTKMKPYGDIITPQAISRAGVFTVHNVGDKWYYEIPRHETGRLFLWVSQIARNQTKVGFGGQAFNNKVVRWDRKNDRILLRQIQYSIVADEQKAVYNAVSAATFPTILMSFDIQTFGSDSTMVIDVTKFFVTDKPEFSPKKQIKAEKLDASRSFIERIATYPENIEADVVLTYEAKEVPSDQNLGSISIIMHHSMVHLPEEPMMPRLVDSRVGFFSVTQEDYGMETHKTERRHYVTRWRLVKKNPQAPLSDPVRPIVFYIDRSVPEKWRPYIKQGVEDWQKAFEQAGFTNAIIAPDAPKIEEDPDWATEDARISSISWLPSPVENAFGPHVHDPRTGEILDSDIKFYHNVMKLLRDWYFVQVAPLDARAETLPFPDELMGELLRYVSTHEVGHALGLQHNMKASSSFPVDSLRSASFTAKYGNEASIMDYGRFNYVAQPGDNARLIPMIGPYDEFAIEWGYKPIPTAGTPDEEKPTLHALASKQSTHPMLRFGSRSIIDPSAQTEDLGADPIAATRYGLMNINRIVPMLVPATTTQPGDDYSALQILYDRLLRQRNREMGHVLGMIGGVIKTDYHVGQDGLVFETVPGIRQKEAMRFLLDQAFTTPMNFLDPDILELIEPSGNVDRITQGQISLLQKMLSEERAKRMTDHAARTRTGQTPYTLAEMLTHLREGLWRELQQNNFEIDPYRRRLQRAYVDELGTKISGEKASKGDLRPLARGELMTLLQVVKKARGKTQHRVTRLHLEDIRTVIEQLLEPR